MLSIILMAVLSSVALAADAEPSCKVTEFEQVAAAIVNCTDIVISNLEVPPGETLNLEFKQSGVTVTFEGRTTFGYKEWTGPLLRVKGNAVNIIGAEGSVLDGQGQLYWDKGGKFEGKKKPKFFRINKAKQNSNFKNITLLNCPVQCTMVDHSGPLTFSGWNIDVSAGDEDGLAQNTEGFHIDTTDGLLIEDAVVKNQDDCIAMIQGTNFVFSNIECFGGHGLTMTVGASFEQGRNIVSNISYVGVVIANSTRGVHLKTHTDGWHGIIEDVSFSNVKMTDISNVAISIEQDYVGQNPTGHPNDNVRIRAVLMDQVSATFIGDESVPVYILCADQACKDFVWSNVTLEGAAHPSNCSYVPDEFSC